MGINRPIDITAEQRKTLLALLEKYLPNTAVWVYGSRVQWTARPQSDLDMVVFTSPSQESHVSALREALEEINLPFRGDLFVWDDVPESFRKHIKRDHIVLIATNHSDGSESHLEVADKDHVVFREEMGRKPQVNGEWHKGWCELPFSEAVQLNPTVSINRGTAYPFVDMSAVNVGSRFAYASEQRLFKGGGSRFRNGDTLMARITPCLENGKIARYQAVNSVSVGHGSTEFIVIRGRPKITDNDFAYYLTKWEEVRNYAIGQMTGTSGRQRVPTDALDHLMVSLPPLSDQRTIAHILGTLDDKIELNRRMNETLEAMARELFKSWFVDFDPVHAKATLKRHDPHLSLRLHDSAIVQANDPSRTGITPPSKAQVNDISRSVITPPLKVQADDTFHSGITPPLKVQADDTFHSGITSPLRGSRQDKGASPPASRWGVIKRQYSQKTLQNAKALRQNQTNAEGLLWHYLRNKQLDGHKFRRQHPIDPYIVDFACLPRKLIVELDGGQHASQQAYDKKRDIFLQDKGYRILRFRNNEVFENCFGVLESIYTALHHHPPLEGGSKDASLSGRGSPPPPQPSPAGSVSATPPPGGREWTPERARAYLDIMDDDFMALFPDSFEDSELGKIPKGWEVKTLEENGTIITGKTPSTRNPNFYGDDVPLLKIPDMHGKIYVVETSTMLSREGASSQLTKALPFGSVSVSCIASPGLVVLNHQETHTNQQINSIIPIDKRAGKYLYWTCRILSTEIISGSSGGSIFGNMNKSTFGALQILNPESTVVRMFDILITPIHNQILLNEQQKILLTHIRDILLPKLVSGEIRIHEIEKLKEASI